MRLFKAYSPHTHLWLNTCPDREGIETVVVDTSQNAIVVLNTYPDREGIETYLVEKFNLLFKVEYLPRPRGD